VAAVDPALRPDGGERGLASWAADDLAALLLPAWDAFLALAEAVDLDRGSRVPGRTARDRCVELGSWPGSRSVAMIAEEARQSAPEAPDPGTFDQKGHDEALRDAWSAAPRREVLDALRRGRDETAGFLASNDRDTLGHRMVRSPIGPLPLTGVVCGRMYDLAVHALDLAPAGAVEPPAALLSGGLAAMTDITGALAARLEITGHASAVTPEGGWTFSAVDGSWRTLELPVVPDGWPRLDAEAADLLDASAGRKNPAALLARRRIRVHHPAGLVPFAPLVEVPGLPGGPALGAAVRNVQAVTGFLRRLPGVPG
jgi:hypothetical protein